VAFPDRAKGTSQLVCIPEVSGVLLDPVGPKIKRNFAHRLREDDGWAAQSMCDPKLVHNVPIEAGHVGHYQVGIRDAMHNVSHDILLIE